MHPSVNYDYLIHDDHIHWCDVEAQGISRCEAQAMREYSAAANTDPIAEVSVSMLIAMGITMVASLVWGMKRREGGTDRERAAATVESHTLGIGA